MEIFNRFSGEIFNRLSGEKIGDFEIADGADLQYADLRGADLRGANLQYADFRGAILQYADLRKANLSDADLQSADLQDANLRNANLRNADLRGAILQYANLQYANLENIRINWNSHDLIAEILRQAAQDDAARRSLAGLVLVSRDLCWKDFLAIAHPQKQWAMDVLRKFETEDDVMPLVPV